MAQTKTSPRSTTTPAKLTGKKLRVSKAEKWARFARLKVDKPYRPVFDVESNWNYRNNTTQAKCKYANELSKRVYHGEDRVEITPELYEAVAEEIRNDKQMALALAIMFSISFVGQNFQEAIELAWSKAKEHDDPNKVINIIKFSFQFIEHMEHLKGLHKAKDDRRIQKEEVFELNSPV